MAVELGTPHPSIMTKRNLATVLWFVTGWTLGALLTAFLGLPSILALVLALSFAVIVRWDPAGVLWTRSATVRPINEVAAELDRKAEARAGTEAEPRSV